MSLPGDAQLKTAPLSSFNPTDATGRAPRTKDRESGGVALQDGTQGLLVQEWTAELVGSDVRLYPSATPSAFVVLFTEAGITELSLSFDQNMNWAVAYMAFNQAKLRWYDATVPGRVMTLLDADVRSPFLTLDDKRPTASSYSDILMFYVRSNRLCYRQQRDRFGVERTLAWLDGNGATIRRAGMNLHRRMQVELVGLNNKFVTGAVMGSSTAAVYVFGFTSIALAMPAGLLTGDLLHAVLMHRSAVTPPAGWTLVSTQACTDGTTTQNLSVFKKTTVAPADSGVSVTFSQASSDRMGLGYFAVRSTSGLAVQLGVSGLAVNSLATNTVNAPSSAAAVQTLFVMVATSIYGIADVTQPALAPGMSLLSGQASQCRLGIAYQLRRTGQTNAGRFTFDLGTPTNNGLAAITLRFGSA